MYVRRMLDAYCATPGTVGVVRRSDRLFVLRLHECALSLGVVENAMTLAAARRLARPHDDSPLRTIRSLAYFSPVVDELLQSQLSPEYSQDLRQRTQNITAPDNYQRQQNKARLRRG